MRIGVLVFKISLGLMILGAWPSRAAITHKEVNSLRAEMIGLEDRLNQQEEKITMGISLSAAPETILTIHFPNDLGRDFENWQKTLKDLWHAQKRWLRAALDLSYETHLLALGDVIPYPGTAVEISGLLPSKDIVSKYTMLLVLPKNENEHRLSTLKRMALTEFDNLGVGLKIQGEIDIPGTAEKGVLIETLRGATIIKMRPGGAYVIQPNGKLSFLPSEPRLPTVLGDPLPPGFLPPHASDAIRSLGQTLYEKKLAYDQFEIFILPDGRIRSALLPAMSQLKKGFIQFSCKTFLSPKWQEEATPLENHVRKTFKAAFDQLAEMLERVRGENP